MELLQLLISFLTKSQSLKAIAPIIEHLKNNDFDIKKALSSLSLETIEPIMSAFASNMNQTPQTEFEHNAVGFSPISNIADKEIIYSLNKLLSPNPSV